MGSCGTSHVAILFCMFYMLPHVAKCVFTFGLIFPMKVDCGELRHFCEDPLCPHPVWKLSGKRPARALQDSSKGGAVETGCSDLYGVIYWFTI